jgi:Cys-tRNA(Pro) deacylase
MSRKERGAPETPATRSLRELRVSFSVHLYEYQEHGGTAVSARELDLPEHSIVKTLVMQDEAARPLIVLMHGDRQVSTRELARQAGRKRIDICPAEVANRHSGYLVGGTSPFATKKAMPVFMEQTISELPKMYINGGRRGFLVGIDPRDLIRALHPVMVSVAQDNE